ncbi:hypothetical protein NVP1161O_030 [Vibrio phage 1.161.O._10N.261.48.C5]|nr:hypothetical protein NVP1161O_030 [Vibrio phage 1.161.O._10N.261.48.C5]
MERKKLIKGDDYTFICNVLDGGIPRDLTGIKDICYQVFENVKEDVLLHEAKLDSGIIVPDMTNGKIYIHLPRQVSENSEKFQLYHKCRIQDQSGRRTTILSDYIEFYKNNLV